MLIQEDDDEKLVANAQEMTKKQNDFTLFCNMVQFLELASAVINMIIF